MIYGPGSQLSGSATCNFGQIKFIKGAILILISSMKKPLSKMLINIWWHKGWQNTGMMHFCYSGGQQHVILVTESEVGTHGDWLEDVRDQGCDLPDPQQHRPAGPHRVHCDPLLPTDQDPQLWNGEKQEVLASNQQYALWMPLICTIKMLKECLRFL